jgi:hypothetical protein
MAGVPRGVGVGASADRSPRAGAVSAHGWRFRTPHVLPGTARLRRISVVSPPFTFAWSPDPRLRSFAPVESVADLDTVLDAVRAASAAAGMPLQVDIWSGDWSGNEPLPEPFVQAVVGHPERGALIWTEAGSIEVGVERGLDPWPSVHCYERAARTEELDGEWTRVTPQSVRDALAELVATGERPRNVAWVDPFNDDEQHVATA